MAVISSTGKRRSFCFIALVIISFISMVTIHVFLNKENSITALLNFHFEQVKALSDTKHVRICCLILTDPKKIFDYARAVHETWAPHCDRHFFILEDFKQDNFTSEQTQFIQQLPILSAGNISHGREHLTGKVNTAFHFVHQHYLNDFDWFVKGDDDTYIALENLRAFLIQQNASEPVTFGYDFKVIVKDGYHSGGGSYVLSQESLRRLHRGHQIPNNTECRWNGGDEDIEIAKCLRSQGVYKGNSLDEHDRERFHPLAFERHYLGTFPDWLVTLAANPLRSHYNCCSDRTISFHYMRPIDQYYLHFLLYRFRLE